MPRAINTRRNTELGLLIAAAVPVILLYAMYLLNAKVALSFSSLAVPIGLFAAFGVAHFATRRFAPEADPAILPLVFLLSGIGIAFVTRLAPTLAIGQVTWLFLSVAAMIAVLVLVPSIEALAQYKFTMGIVGVALLLLPMLIGTSRGGSKLWIVLGPLSFQPGELAKILIVLFLAAYLAENREMLSASAIKAGPLDLPRPRMLAPMLLMWGMSLLVVVFERDLGSALLFFTFFVIMLYVCTGRVGYVLVSILLLAVGGVFCYHFFGHVQTRVQIWLNPFKDPSGKGLQIVQSLYSLADGGLVGSGIGKGLPKLIPVVESDFIFSAIGEEMGLLGASAVLICYMLLAVRGLATAARAKSDISAFTAVGLTAAIAVQAFLIVGGVTKLLPLTGVTLPFMSQGGSSLLASFIIVGLLLKAGDEGTGREAQIQQGSGSVGSQTQVEKAMASVVHGTHARASRGLDTPESGVLGRVALGNRLVSLVTVFTMMFALLVANLTYIQVFKADYYQTLPNNNHTIAKSAKVQRGAIIAADGATLALALDNANGSFAGKVDVASGGTVRLAAGEIVDISLVSDGGFEVATVLSGGRGDCDKRSVRNADWLSEKLPGWTFGSDNNGSGVCVNGSYFSNNSQINENGVNNNYAAFLRKSGSVGPGLIAHTIETATDGLVVVVEFQYAARWYSDSGYGQSDGWTARVGVLFDGVQVYATETIHSTQENFKEWHTCTVEIPVAARGEHTLAFTAIDPDGEYAGEDPEALLDNVKVGVVAPIGGDRARQFGLLSLDIADGATLDLDTTISKVQIASLTYNGQKISGKVSAATCPFVTGKGSLSLGNGLILIIR